MSSYQVSSSWFRWHLFFTVLVTFPTHCAFNRPDISCRVQILKFVIFYFPLSCCWYCESRDSLVSVATRLRVGRSEVRILAGARDFFHQTSKPAVGPTQPHIQRVLVFFLRPKATGAWSWPVTSFLVPKLRMSGCLPLLPLYAFMAWTDTTLPVPSMPLVLPRTYSLCHCIVSILSLYLGRRATVQLLSSLKHRGKKYTSVYFGLQIVEMRLDDKQF
jgi:hypothetical protein